MDDPSDRVDKADGRNVENTEAVFTSLSPTALPTLRPQMALICIIKSFFIFFEKQEFLFRGDVSCRRLKVRFWMRQRC